jgi:3-hydroxyisobutyryl-CoA hydrolase
LTFGQEWENSELANIIIIAGAGEKSFCAGGDVAAVVKTITSEPDNPSLPMAYFSLEYQLDHLIATYPKPYIAYMDGITMGGGVGLSVHAPFRIATDRTRFAMPETSIGFFPDVGASFFLPRLEGSVGTYLALTSKQLSGVDAYYAGLATHYIHHTTLPSLTARLGELEFKDYDPLLTRLSLINQTIEEFSSSLPHDQTLDIVGKTREAIDRCFSHPTIEKIIQALEAEKKGEMRSWAEATLQELSERSPTSLKVTLKQMIIGRRWNISETFQREFHLAARMIAHPDFVSGVSAKLLDKPPTKPKWKPSTLEAVEATDVNGFFIVEGQERLPLIGDDARWTEYPTNFGLPSEADVRVVVQENRDGRNNKKKRDAEILRLQNVFKKKYGGKVGVSEKVIDVVVRKCGFHNELGIVWKEDLKG